MDHCFFCQQHIQNEHNIFNDTLKESINAFNSNTNNCKLDNSKNIKEYVLKISHYLKVPREVVKEDEQTFTQIQTCQNCTEISKNLSDVCVQLEIIQMKINHYLNLLANQITEGTTVEPNKKHQNNSSLSTFQKTLHQICVSKVRKNEETSNPQICLQKCPEEIMEDTKPAIIKVEEGPVTSDEIIIEELHTCIFCDYLVSGSYDLLQSHMETQHPEQFQDEYLDEISSASGRKRPSKPLKARKSSKRTLIPKKCEKCGNVFSCQGSLNRHLKENSNCAEGGGSKRKSFKDRFECSNCNRRFARREGLLRHFRKVCGIGTVIDHGYVEDASKNNEDVMLIEEDPLKI